MRHLLLVIISLVLAANSVSAGEANVFVYHRFGDARYPSTNIGTGVFEAQLEYLRQEAFTVLTLGEVVRRLRTGSSIPERCAVLTVDDAYRSFLSGGMPLLRRYGYPVTLFVSTAVVGRPGYLSWEELRRLAEEGVEIGNHSHGHDYLLKRRNGEDRKAWLERVKRDMLRAQDLLARNLGRPPALFAYPFGEYSPELADLVKGLGFAAAAAQQSGVISAQSDLYALPRFPMGGPFATLQGFRERVRMRALPVLAVDPDNPVIGRENPPTLTVTIARGEADLSRLRCYVQGQQEPGEIRPDPAVPGRFVVRARAPLVGRRTKYTLTAPGRNTEDWFWFSHLWVNLEAGE